MVKSTKSGVRRSLLQNSVAVSFPRMHQAVHVRVPPPFPLECGTPSEVPWVQTPLCTGVGLFSLLIHLAESIDKALARSRFDMSPDGAKAFLY